MPAGIGAVVLSLALAVTLWPFGSPAPATAKPGPAGIPARVADYSYFTGDVSASPPGRAVAIFQHGFGVELFDFEQAIVVGADGDTYRRLDVAEDRAGSETQGDPAPMLLSPDGSFVAVGDWDADDPDLALIDLHTGEVEVHEVPGGHSALPLAWSADSTLVSYLTTAEPKYPYSGMAITGEIGMLELATGKAHILPGAADVRAAAFSPDGSELAIHRITPDTSSTGLDEGVPQIGGGTVEIVGLDGSVRRRLTMDPDAYLDGPNAWSPDGTLLAAGRQWRTCREGTGDWDEEESQQCVERREAISFVDASGRDAPTPPPLKAGDAADGGLLGWTGPDTVLVLDYPANAGQEESYGDPSWVTELALEGGEPRRLSAIPGGGNYGVGNFQMAAALLPDLQLREPGQVDRGLWPTQVRAVGAVALGGSSMLAWVLTQRRRRVSALGGPVT